MQAYVLQSFDDAPRLVRVPQPEIGHDQVLVRVHAVSINPVDLAIASGEAKNWLEYRFPVTIGRDLAGVVERIGEGVTSFTPGDRVFGYIARDYAHDGSFAEYVAIPEGEFIVPAPDSVDAVHAAALGLAAVTATMCLDAAGVHEGSSVLVNGATGGVGGYAVQIAKARGAKLVVGSGRPGAEEAHVRSLGADAVVDWSAPDFARRARQTAGSGFDALIDVVTGDPAAFATLARMVLADGGRAATTIGAADPERLDGIEATNVWSAPEVPLLRSIAELAAEGRVRAPVRAVYGFGEIEQAFEAVRRGALGKVCVRLMDDHE
ncbi:MAG TPA: NADP-dependent oxidoreductase [Solirubrobacteraceae bacterium]|nr:NADP-dependent oxidoreductase [Solirubrobacteraceae bacterium]